MPILVLNTLSRKALWCMEVHVFKRKKVKREKQVHVGCI